MPRKALATVGVLLLLTAAVAAFVLVRSGGAAPGSTPQATFRDHDGDGVLERARGEALLDRTEIAPRSRAVRRPARVAQITDPPRRGREAPARPRGAGRPGPPLTA